MLFFPVYKHSTDCENTITMSCNDSMKGHVQKIHGEIIIVLLLIFPGVKTQTEKNNTLMESETREGLQGDPPPPLLTQT